MEQVIQFIVICLIAALGLWVLSQFPSLDSMVVRFIRIVVIVVLSVLALDLLLMLLFHRHIHSYMGGG